MFSSSVYVVSFDNRLQRKAYISVGGIDHDGVESDTLLGKPDSELQLLGVGSVVEVDRDGYRSGMSPSESVSPFLMRQTPAYKSRHIRRKGPPPYLTVVGKSWRMAGDFCLSAALTRPMAMVMS